MAILSSKEKKLVLSDIYQWILDNYPYFRRRGPGWRNSIRHNLSLNDCFVKSGRSANGKGHYWAIHPANTEDFTKGDFRRRRAQRKVRKAMGLSVPDEEDSPSPSPTPPCGSGAVAAVVAMQDWQSRMFGLRHQDAVVPAPAMIELLAQFDSNIRGAGDETKHVHRNPEPAEIFRLDEEEIRAKTHKTSCVVPTKKRLFDVESLLAPDTPKSFTINRRDVVNRENEKQRNGQSPVFCTSSPVRNNDVESNKFTRFDGGSKTPIPRHLITSHPCDVSGDVMTDSNNDVDCDDDDNGVDMEEIKYSSSDEPEESNVCDGRERSIDKQSVVDRKEENDDVIPETLNKSSYRNISNENGNITILDDNNELTMSGPAPKVLKYPTNHNTQDIESDMIPTTARASQELRDMSRDVTRQQFLRDFSQITPHRLDWRAVFQQSRFHPPSPFGRSARQAGCTTGPHHQSSAWVGGSSPVRQGRYSPLQRSPVSVGQTLRPAAYSRGKSSDVIRSPDYKHCSDVIRSPDYKHCSDVKDSEMEDRRQYLSRTIKLETS